MDEKTTGRGKKTNTSAAAARKKTSTKKPTTKKSAGKNANAKSASVTTKKATKKTTQSSAKATKEVKATLKEPALSATAADKKDSQKAEKKHEGSKILSAFKNFYANKRLVTWLSFGFGTLLIVGFVSLWVWKVALNTNTVFWDMIDTSLKTPGVTRSVVQESSDSRSIETSRFVFSDKTAVAISRDQRQKTEAGENITRIEGIGLNDADYQRYLELKRPDASGQSVDYSSLYNQWVNSSSATGDQAATPPSILQQSLLAPVIMGQLPTKERRELVQELIKNKAYKINQNSKVKRQNGKFLSIITGEIKLKPFADTLGKHAKLLGVTGAESINGGNYSDSDVLTVEYGIDLISRQLIYVAYTNSGIKETYTGYGITKPIERPQGAIDNNAFQEKIRKIQPAAS